MRRVCPMEKKAESVKTAVKQANEAGKFFCANFCGKLPARRQRNLENPAAQGGGLRKNNGVKKQKKSGLPTADR